MFRTKKVFNFSQGKKQLKQTVVSEYDTQQNEILRLIYNAQNELRLMVKKDFSPQNQLLKSTTFNSKGQLLSSVEYLYNQAQRLVEKRFFNAQKQIIARNIWTYEQNHLIEFKKNNKENQTIERKEFKYDKNGHLSEVWYFNINGQVITKRHLYYTNKILTEEKIFSTPTKLKAHKILRYNESSLPEFIFWYDSQGKIQRTEFFEYYDSGQLKTEVVNDIFGQQFFRKKFNAQGQILRSYHLYRDHFEKMELHFYDDTEKKLRQEKYSIKHNKTVLEQQILFQYDEHSREFLQEKKFYC